MGIEDVLTGPRAPWQNPFVERFIGSARRECLDHVIVFNEAGLKRLMTLYCSHCEQSRTHLALDKDTSIPRPVMRSGDGDIVAIPEVGGLHHRSLPPFNVNGRRASARLRLRKRIGGAHGVQILGRNLLIRGQTDSLAGTAIDASTAPCLCMVSTVSRQRSVEMARGMPGRRFESRARSPTRSGTAR
jgi:hypothetical protein